MSRERVSMDYEEIKAKLDVLAGSKLNGRQISERGEHRQLVEGLAGKCNLHSMTHIGSSTTTQIIYSIFPTTEPTLLRRAKASESLLDDTETSWEVPGAC